jgi:hypothetical protein
MSDQGYVKKSDLKKFGFKVRKDNSGRDEYYHPFFDKLDFSETITHSSFMNLIFYGGVRKGEKERNEKIIKILGGKI